MAIEVAVEEVADNLEELAEATRSINTTAVGYFIGGVCVGLGLGFYYGYKFNREKIRAEAFKQSEEELEQLREVYQQRAMVGQDKPSVESIVEEKGYSTPIESRTSSMERPLPAPVPGLVDPKTINATPPVVVTYEGGKSKNRDWDYPEELAKRSPDEPYVIHQDEFKNTETGYDQVTYTYYAEDDVLTGEDDRPVPHPDLVVGQENLKWGHGTDDIDVVFVRNERLELEMEICRTPGSYEQEVLGIIDDEAS